jgi:hypothetical protein
MEDTMRVGVLAAALAGAAAVLGSAGLAAAQTYMSPVQPSVFDPNGSQPHRPNLVTPVGIGMTLGGGVTGFTGERARNFTSTGGGWNARLVIGTRSVIAGELAYAGGIQDVNAIGLDNGATLLSNGGELLGRLNLLPGMVQPYVFGGVAYVNYRLMNEDYNTSSVSASDDVVQFPVGAGLAFRYDGLLVDARGTFRPTIEEDMFDDGEGMESWSASLGVGAEF